MIRTFYSKMNRIIILLFLETMYIKKQMWQDLTGLRSAYTREI